MPDETASAPDRAKETIAMSAATMGHDLTAALLAELRTMPEHWPKLNQEMQQKIIERFKEKVSDAVRKAQHMLTASNFQAVPAKLEFVNRKGGIRAGLTVAADSLCRHALFDAAGGKVLVVITDPNAWLQRMDEIKAVGNQADLFESDANYDPTRDQPGYRRDQDPFAPGISWAEMKAKLASGDAAKVPAGDDKSVDPERVNLAMLQEALGKCGVHLSLGALQSRAPEDLLAATVWLDSVAAGGLTPEAKSSAPAWFPPFDQPQGDAK